MRLFLWFSNTVRSVYYYKFFFKRRRKSDYFLERVRKKSKIVTSCVQTVFVFFIGGDRKHRVASAPLSPFHFGLLTYTSSWPSTATHRSHLDSIFARGAYFQFFIAPPRTVLEKANMFDKYFNQGVLWPPGFASPIRSWAKKESPSFASK